MSTESSRAWRESRTPEQREADRLKKNEYMRKYRSPDNPAYQRVLSAQRKKRTGFTDEAYFARHAEQGGKCAICGDAEDASRCGALHGDHDHQTMQPRGLLCSRCNTALGLFLEDPVRLRSAIDYLAHWADAPNGNEVARWLSL